MAMKNPTIITSFNIVNFGNAPSLRFYIYIFLQILISVWNIKCLFKNQFWDTGHYCQVLSSNSHMNYCSLVLHAVTCIPWVMIFPIMPVEIQILLKASLQCYIPVFQKTIIMHMIRQLTFTNCANNEHPFTFIYLSQILTRCLQQIF